LNVKWTFEVMYFGISAWKGDKGLILSYIIMLALFVIDVKKLSSLKLRVRTTMITLDI